MTVAWRGVLSYVSLVLLDGDGGGAVRQCSQPGGGTPMLRPSVVSVLCVASFHGIVDSNAQLELVSGSYYRQKEIFVQMLTEGR